MTGPVRDKAAENRLSDQCKVSKEVKDLMPDEFIGKSQRGIVQHPIFSQHDRVLQRAAANQAARLQLFNLMIEPESSGRRDEIRIILTAQLHFELLFTDDGMREVDFVTDAEG